MSHGASPAGGPARGEVWLVDLNPTVGHEQAGIRPALVVSTDPLNRSPAGLAIVAPITGTSHDLTEEVFMTTIRARDLDLATLERLKRRVVRDERLGDRAGVLHVPSEASNAAEAPDASAPSNPSENRADEFVIHLDAKSLRLFLSALEASILADRPPLTSAVDDARERARRFRETLAGRDHSDSGAIQHEDRRR